MPRTIIIDVGAGMYATYQEKLASHPNLTIVAFEPHPTLFKKMLHTKQLWNNNNNTIDERLQVHQCAVSDKSRTGVPFHLLNDPIASSLSPLNNKGVAKWKYPFGRKRFSVQKTIKVNTTSLSDFVNDNPYIKTNGIELLNIDVQGDCLKVLHGISRTVYCRIKRIIIKCIDTPFELYRGQSDVVDIIDELKIHDFTLIGGSEYSRGQEQILELVNKRFKPTQTELQPLFKVSGGTLSIDI